MVKKLFKHEFLAYARVMGVVYIILLTVAAAGRIIQFFRNDSVAYEIISTISGLTYGVSVFAVLAFICVFAIVRFYRNLFTAEGYLTFTLPVTTAQHILVKVVTAITMMVATFLVVLLSGCIFTAGELLVEYWKAFAYIYAKIHEVIGVHAVLFLVEFLVLYLLALISGLMMYYVFICIGQLFKKNRILAAVGAYFVYYIIMQILSSIFLVVFSFYALTDAFSDLMLRLVEFIEAHPYIAAHTGVGIGAVLLCLWILLEFVVTKKIISSKLNLE